MSKDVASRLIDLIDYKVNNRETISKSEIEAVVGVRSASGVSDLVHVGPGCDAPKPYRRRPQGWADFKVTYWTIDGVQFCDVLNDAQCGPVWWHDIAACWCRHGAEKVN